MADVVTDAEVEALLKTAELGSEQKAADALGITRISVHHRLASLRDKLDAQTTLQAYHFLLGGVRLVRSVRLERVK